MTAILGTTNTWHFADQTVQATATDDMIAKVRDDYQQLGFDLNVLTNTIATPSGDVQVEMLRRYELRQHEPALTAADWDHLAEGSVFGALAMALVFVIVFWPRLFPRNKR